MLAPTQPTTAATDMMAGNMLGLSRRASVSARQASARRMADGSEQCQDQLVSDEPSRFKTSLEALERAAHVPTKQQVEAQPDADTTPSDWAWDEERRQARLAGGA